MRVKQLHLLLLAMILASLTTTVAIAATPALAQGAEDCPAGFHSVRVESKAKQTSFTVGAQEEVACVPDLPQAASATDESRPNPFDDTARGMCLAGAVVAKAETSSTCPSGEPAAPQQVTLPMVLRAFEKIELPKPTLSIQPPGGKTLVNFETIFSTDADSFRRTVRLLGKRVQLDITPVSYVWAYGDGTTETTEGPGVEWSSERPMSDYLIHTYEDADITMKPKVSVAYSATFRVGNGPWRDVSGTVTSDGPPVDLRVVEAESVLLGTS